MHEVSARNISAFDGCTGRLRRGGAPYSAGYVVLEIARCLATLRVAKCNIVYMSMVAAPNDKPI